MAIVAVIVIVIAIKKIVVGRVREIISIRVRIMMMEMAMVVEIVVTCPPPLRSLFFSFASLSCFRLRLVFHTNCPLYFSRIIFAFLSYVLSAFAKAIGPVKYWN